MNEEQKRIKALIDEQIQLLQNNPKLKNKSDEQLWAAELNSRRMKVQMADPEFRKDWDETNKQRLEKLHNDPNWLESVRRANELTTQSPEWLESVKIASQKRSQDPAWRENVAIANKTKAETNIEWRENQLAGIRKTALNIEWQENIYNGAQKRANDPKWIENNKKAAQIRNKKVNANGSIYMCVNDAILDVMKEKNIAKSTAAKWFREQMTELPDKYFFVDENDNKIENQIAVPKNKTIKKPTIKSLIDPKLFDPTFMTLEERKALAKMKREQGDLNK